MLLGHAGVGMNKLGGDHTHRYATHGEVRSVGMAQDVKVYRRFDAGAPARLVEWTFLMRCAPHLAVGAQEDVIGMGEAGRPRDEGILGLIGQNDVTNLAFAQADRERAALRVEILVLETAKLSIAASGQ